MSNLPPVELYSLTIKTEDLMLPDDTIGWRSRIVPLMERAGISVKKRWFDCYYRGKIQEEAYVIASEILSEKGMTS